MLTSVHVPVGLGANSASEQEGRQGCSYRRIQSWWENPFLWRWTWRNASRKRGNRRWRRIGDIILEGKRKGDAIQKGLAHLSPEGSWKAEVAQTESFICLQKAKEFLPENSIHSKQAKARRSTESEAVGTGNLEEEWTFRSATHCQ